MGTYLRWSGRAVVAGLLVMLAGFGPAHGQDTGIRDLRIAFDSPASPVQVKYVHEGVREQDAGALVWYAVDDRHALVRCHVELDLQALRSFIGASGLVITELYTIGDGAARQATDLDDEAAPQHTVTGDEAMDDLRYEIAKRAWVERHPVAYQQLNGSTQAE